MSAEIMSVEDLLSLELRVPGYQRPYRWTAKNMADLLGDMDNAMSEAREHQGFKYRIGSVILHENAEEGCYDLVDGQQRVISLVLLMLALDGDASCPLIERSAFSSREMQRNVRANFEFAAEWVAYQADGWRERAKASFGDTLEAVVIVVGRVEEAFQLFDSQNTRGRSLDPHDLLKAYHLRAMRDAPHEMRHVVTRWEEHPADKVREIFASYLYPVLNWKTREKTSAFTPKEIGAFKGVPSGSGYTYAARARRAAPCFQIGSPFIEGEDFFLMAERYLELRDDMELEIGSNAEFEGMRGWLGRKGATAGLRHATGLFWCALLAYYDRFHNFDARAVRKLFAWAFMIRVDMQSLGFGTINKYAVGEGADQYTNEIPMFSEIARARLHTDVANLVVRVRPAPAGSSAERRELGEFLCSWARGGE